MFKKINLKLSNFILVTLLIINLPIMSDATFMEQILINTKAMSLANSVTANPPGHMSIHYNPAGLTNLEEGISISQGFAIARIERSYKFFPDEEYSQNTDKKFDPFDDPMSYSKGHVRNGRIYLPFAGPVNLPVLVAPVPFGISFKQTCSKWTFASATYAPFAGGFEHSHENAARYQGEAVYLQHLVLLSPSVAFKLNEQLSFGLSLGVGQTAIGAITDIRAPSLVELTNKMKGLGGEVDGFPEFDVDIGIFDKLADLKFDARDDISPSINLGFLWKPSNMFSFGFVYQSPIKTTIKGEYRFAYEDDVMSLMNWLQSVRFDIGWDRTHTNKKFESGKIDIVDFEFPQRIQMGIMLSPIKKLRLMCDFHWANWSSTKNYILKFDKEIQVVMLAKLLGYEGGKDTIIYPKDFDDTWHLSFGMEYDITNWLSFRMGYEDRQTCAKDHLFDLFSLPDVDMLGGGIGIKLPRGVEIDLGMAFLTYNDYQVDNDTSTNLNSLMKKMPIYSPYAGQDYETSFKAYIGSMNVKMPLDVVLDIAEKQLMWLESIFSL